MSAPSVCVPLRARWQPEALCHRQGSWSAGTPALPAFLTWRQTALSSARVPPVSACPALRPRWCPEHLAPCLRDCCLPGAANRRLSLSASSRGYPQWTTTILIAGLDHAACTFATPGSAPPLTRTHAGSLLTWGQPLVRSDLSRLPRDSPTGEQCPISWIHLYVSNPKVSDLLDASSDWLGLSLLRLSVSRYDERGRHAGRCVHRNNDATAQGRREDRPERRSRLAG